MDFGSIDFDQVLYLFLLLLIGMGPKIALVPFLDMTADMDGETKRRLRKSWFAPRWEWDYFWSCWAAF